jgi:hypothetical protein
VVQIAKADSCIGGKAMQCCASGILYLVKAVNGAVLIVKRLVD